ncbi:MAG: DUF4166 domain-containing protein [Oricola sp.]|jgi:hypothetical protein|nr:DUF4166 domain-containing protein [Oricola sp.]
MSVQPVFFQETHAAPPRLARLLPDDRFQSLVQEEDWAALPERVRQRFSLKARRGDSIVYRGVTTELKQNLAGLVLTQAARIIGAPLPLDKRSEARPAIVAITDDPDRDGQVWTRLYARGAGFPQSVNSAKRFSGPTGLEEHVGGGVSMSLILSVEGGALFFSSVDYFLTVFGVRIKFPEAFAPGRMVIGHHDLGAGRFAFTLTLTHALFGLMISQTTIFHDMTEADHD